jgi:hypothetical protein
MNTLFDKQIGKLALVFMDEILVYLKSFQHHKEQVWKVLQIVSDNH